MGCHRYTSLYLFLFSPLGKLGGRAIYFACVNFFLSLFSFFIDRSENNYLRICWTDFRNLFTNESVLGADDRFGPLFPISQGTLPWQPIL